MPNSTIPTSASPADAWRPQEGFYVTLPSEMVVKLRRSLDIFDMMQQGNIPNALKGIVEEALQSGDPSKLSMNSVDENALIGMVSFVDDVVCRITQEPRVRPNPSREEDEEEADYEDRVDRLSPGEGSIWIKWMSVEDRMFIFSVAQGGTTDIAKFREELLGDVGAVPDVVKVPKPTKRTGGTAKKRS